MSTRPPAGAEDPHIDPGSTVDFHLEAGRILSSLPFDVQFFLTEPDYLIDPDPSNNSSTDVDTVINQADLQVAKDDGVTTAVPGGSVTYTINVTNSAIDSIEGPFSVSSRNNLLRTIDPTTGATLGSVTITLAGATVDRGHGLAAQPAVAITTYNGDVKGDGGARDLATIDPVTGVATTALRRDPPPLSRVDSW